MFPYFAIHWVREGCCEQRKLNFRLDLMKMEYYRRG